MNDYRYMKFPGKEFQTQLVTDKNTIKKLLNILKMYTGNSYPLYIPTLLNSRFLVNRIYKGFIGITLGTIIAFLLSSQIWTLLLGLICMGIMGILIGIFYDEASDYKMLNTLVAHSTPEDIQKYCKELNNALLREKKSLIKHK